jgi:leucyl/phenylalanyl-tRNA--protein transferase
MFAHEPDASKVAFVTLVEWIKQQGIQLIDSQVYTDHLARFGAEEWPRPRYLERLKELVYRPTRQGRWQL